MIPVQLISAKPQVQWKRDLAEAITQPEELLAAVGLNDRQDLLIQAKNAQALFKLKVPRDFVSRMEFGNANDPLLRQVLPLGEEFQSPEDYLSDPVGDMNALKQPGLLHKYHGRVLMVTTGICAINCRYCFRREYPYAEASARQADWHQSLDYIQSDSTITEVILSGGDPLSLSDSKLDKLISRLEEIPHLKRLRIHSRLPVVLPSRITTELVQRLAQSHLQVVMVIHSNHPNELSETVAQAISQLRLAQINCLNQAVLLKDINDQAEVMAELSERLFELGVIPYYLHLLDKVKGAAHFDVCETKALDLLCSLQQRLPGYLVPKLVREIAGEPNKTPVLHSSL